MRILSQGPATAWTVRRPVLSAAALSLVPVSFTAVGFAVAQAVRATDLRTYVLVAAAVSLCVLVAVVIVVGSRRPAADFGMGRPSGGRTVAWWLPLLSVVVVGLVGSGVTVERSAVAVLAWLAIAVGINEELYYRGLLLAVLLRYGPRRAVVYSSALFGVLHLANLANGKSVGYAALQLVFAALVGVVAAELVVVTRSIWPGVVFHAAFDFVSYLGGDQLTVPALVALAIQTLVLLAYAAWLWRRLP